MNTPEPCCTCVHLYWNILYEEDESYTGECLVDRMLGDPDCSKYKNYMEERKREQNESRTKRAASDM